MRCLPTWPVADMEPLAAEWAAPPHPFLLEEQGEPAARWKRRGPAALTRAWCIFELAKALALRRTLHVLLSPASVRLFEERMTKHYTEFADGQPGFEWIGQILGRVDVKREYPPTARHQWGNETE